MCVTYLTNLKRTPNNPKKSYKVSRSTHIPTLLDTDFIPYKKQKKYKLKKYISSYNRNWTFLMFLGIILLQLFSNRKNLKLCHQKKNKKRKEKERRGNKTCPGTKLSSNTHWNNKIRIFTCKKFSLLFKKCLVICILILLQKRCTCNMSCLCNHC